MKPLPAVGRHGRAAHADVGAGALRPRRQRQLAAGAVPQGGAPDRRSSAPSSRPGRLQAGGGPIAARPGARSRRELPLHADGRAADAARDARVRRRADPARRPRAQRLDVRGARRGRDADRHLLGHRRRHRRAEGAAARRRQRRRHADAARDRRGRHAGARRRGDPRQARAEGEDPGLRPPRLPHRGSARHAPAPDVEGARRASRPARAGSRCRSASRRWSRARRS